MKNVQNLTIHGFTALGKPGRCAGSFTGKIICGECGGLYGRKVWEVTKTAKAAAGLFTAATTNTKVNVSLISKADSLFETNKEMNKKADNKSAVCYRRGVCFRKKPKIPN